jgi:hypothetical protein
MLSLFADLILIILPLLNSLLALALCIVLIADLSALKKNILRIILLISCLSVIFYLILYISDPTEETTPFGNYLLKEIKFISYSGVIPIVLLGLAALLRSYVFAGKENVPRKASGRIYSFSFKRFFRSYWRWIIYICAIALWIHTYFSIRMFVQNYEDLHPSGTEQF